MKVFGKELGKAIKFPPFLDNFVDRLLPSRKNYNEELVTIPSTNISDDDVAFELSVALPGHKKKDVFIEMVDDYITITAQQQRKTRNGAETGYAKNSFTIPFTGRSGYRIMQILKRWRQK